MTVARRLTEVISSSLMSSLYSSLSDGSEGIKNLKLNLDIFGLYRVGDLITFHDSSNLYHPIDALVIAELDNSENYFGSTISKIIRIDLLSSSYDFNNLVKIDHNNSPTIDVPLGVEGFNAYFLVGEFQSSYNPSISPKVGNLSSSSLASNPGAIRPESLARIFDRS